MRLALLLLIVLAAAGSWLWASDRPAPLPAGSDSARRLAPGPLPVTRLPLEVVDRERDTPANGGFAGAPVRRLEGHLWYPDRGGPYPLVVHVHGFTSRHDSGAYLAEHLASHGFVVAAVDHPLTHLFAPGGPRVADVINQPGDVSFLIDRLLARSADAGDPLAALIDGGRIGVMGISLGGLTTTLATFHPALRDPRIDAAISIAGPTVFLTSRFFADVDTPFLMVAGDADALVPWEHHARPIPRKVPAGRLVTLREASHTGFAGATAWLRWLRNPDALGCWMVQRNIEPGEEERWGALLGTAAQGIDRAAENHLCERERLPATMNVLRQQRLTRLVVRAFFEGELAAMPATRRAAQRFLRETLPREVAALDYRDGA